MSKSADRMTKSECREYLAARNVKASSRATLAELRRLVLLTKYGPDFFANITIVSLHE